MSNNENLRDISTCATEVQREIRSKGGKARAEKIRQRKSFKETLELLMSLETEIDGVKMTNQQAVNIALMKKALSGDVQAFQTLRDTLGQKPVENLNVEIEQNEGIEEMQKALIELARNGSNTNN